MSARTLLAVLLRRMRGEHHSRGIGLSELLVAMMVTLVVAAMVVGIFISATKSIAVAAAANNDTGTAANTMNELNRVIRSAVKNQESGVDNPPLIRATPETLELYSLVDMDAVGVMRPVKVVFALNAARELVEKRYQATLAADGSWTFPSSSPMLLNRTMPGRLLPRSTGYPVDLFTYVKADGSELTAPAGGLSATQLAEIVAVKVSLAVRANAKSSSTPARLTAKIGMPNIGLDRQDLP